MYFFQGFFFAAGFLSFIVILAVGVIFSLKRRKQYAEVSVWKEYLNHVKINEDYREAQFVVGLINNKADSEKIPLPKGYFIIKKVLFVEDHASVEGVEIKIEKKILKKSPGK
ncbi:hypothetical protein [Chitinophaga hostae]|uniref:hypothetical protein n=1 Tax=Chitinophaga hostae TaxID=2831022 RepID=UPI003F69BF90